MALDDHHKHFIGQVAQKALIERDGKILLVQYPESEAHGMGGKWDLPGGRLHVGETALEGVMREVEEEIGTPVIIEDVLVAGVNVIREDFQLFFVIYRAHLADANATLVPEIGEIGSVEWFDAAEVSTLPFVFPLYQELLRPFLK